MTEITMVELVAMLKHLRSLTEYYQYPGDIVQETGLSESDSRRILEAVDMLKKIDLDKLKVR
jgi:hypothetical protein